MAALRILVLWNFAIAQPLYDKLGQKRVFLEDLHIGLSAVWWTVLVVSLALPASLCALGLLVGRSTRRGREWLHTIAVFGLLSVLSSPLLQRFITLPGLVTMGGSLTAGALLTCWYFRSARARMLVAVAAPGVFVFPAILLWQSPLSGYLFPAPSSVATVDVPRPVPIVMVVFDEFSGLSLMTPDHQLDTQRFPNFARLAEQSTWYRRAGSVHNDTPQAVPAILSGRYPTHASTFVPADRPQNLFSVLAAGGGYELAAFEPVSGLAPSTLDREGADRPGVGRQFTTLLESLSRVFLHHVTPAEYRLQLPRIRKDWFGYHESRTVDVTRKRGVFRYNWGSQRGGQFEHFLNCLDGESDPTLYFIHVILPHFPWRYLPSGRAYAPDDDQWELFTFDQHNGLDEYWAHDELAIIQSQQRYLLQLGYLDRQIGRLLDRLEATALLDRSLLIVTADHGVAHRPNAPRRATSPATAAEVVSVPLFVKRPGQTQGEISDQLVESVDLLPTIAEITGVSLPEPVDGWSVDRPTPEGRLAYTNFTHELSRVSIEPEVLSRSDAPALLRQRFADASDPLALYRIGPLPELIGRRVDSFQHTAMNALPIEFIRYGDEVSDSPDAIVPCFFEGYVRSPNGLTLPPILAVAVEGEICAMTRTYTLNRLRDRWGVMIPESKLHPGHNDIQFYSVTGNAPDWTLTPCQVIRKDH
ncbi:MAG: sulfatase-like hydrolase/transferase [Planctomycetales bacterium]